MNHSFKLVIPPVFDYAWRFSEGRALVWSKKDSKYAYIDEQGKLVTSYRFLNASPFSDGLAVVNEHGLANPAGLYGYIDKQGSYRIWPLFQQASPFSDGRAHVGEYMQSL